MNIKDFFKQMNLVTDEYSDTLALILLSVGGFFVAVSIGTQVNGGTTAGYGFVYLKHPVWLWEGLISVVTGFAMQLSDNLTKNHGLPGNKIFKPIVIIYIIMTLYVFLS